MQMHEIVHLQMLQSELCLLCLVSHLLCLIYLTGTYLLTYWITGSPRLDRYYVVAKNCQEKHVLFKGQNLIFGMKYRNTVFDKLSKLSLK